MAYSRMKKRTEPTIIDCSEEELQGFLQRAKYFLPKDDFELLKTLCESYRYMTDELGNCRRFLKCR